MIKQWETYLTVAGHEVKIVTKTSKQLPGKPVMATHKHDAGDACVYDIIYYCPRGITNTKESVAWSILHNFEGNPVKVGDKPEVRGEVVQFPVKK